VRRGRKGKGRGQRTELEAHRPTIRSTPSPPEPIWNGGRIEEHRRRRGLTLKSSDDQRGSRGNNGSDGLSVLDGQLDGDLETLPVSGSLGDILSDLLGGLLEW